MRDSNARNDHSRISPTAKVAAYWRSLSDTPYAREIAEAVGAELTTREIIGESMVIMRRFSPAILEMRYKAINYGLKQSRIENVLELACGLSPRGLEVAAEGGIYLGTDLPDMISESALILTAIALRMGITTANLLFQPANVLVKAELENAAAHFDGKRFAICNEGLLMYLNREEKATMAAHVRELLLRVNGCWITPDIIFKEIRERLLAMSGPEAQQVTASGIVRNLSERTGSDIIGNDFADKAEARRFYEELGFGVEEIPMYAGDYKLSTDSLISENMKENFLKILCTAKAWILTPKP